MVLEDADRMLGKNAVIPRGGFMTKTYQDLTKEILSSTGAEKLDQKQIEKIS